MRFVLDNSVCMRWLFGDGNAQSLRYASGVLAIFDRVETQAIVPSVWLLEVANVVARAEARGVLRESRSAEFLGALRDMAIEVDAATSEHAWADTLSLARRHSLTAYDASYLELALREGLPLATLDEALRSAAERTGVRAV
ncbi:MAG: type II toxin-antitoxin system VapC family toxin [Burkholderiaceae bacterium]|nr:type II toxin-antitoxin system VapC family toxin [Burkholderiaceae bacterium]